MAQDGNADVVERGRKLVEETDEATYRDGSVRISSNLQFHVTGQLLDTVAVEKQNLERCDDERIRG